MAAVTYDSHDPIDRTLASFAINLNNSPSLAQILTQARGEQVEVTLVNTANQPGSLTGKIIGVEQQQVPSKEGTVPVSVLNLWCAEGVRAVKLTEVQRLRFANPVMENEVRRALETLALSHDSQKKAVSLHFAGEGKRKVEVGYVVENPIWKTSYRLVLGKDEAEAVPAGVGGGREPDGRGLARGHDGARQRAADLVQDGPVQPPVRRPADRRAGIVRLPPAADLQRGDEAKSDERARGGEKPGEAGRGPERIRRPAAERSGRRDARPGSADGGRVRGLRNRRADRQRGDRSIAGRGRPDEAARQDLRPGPRASSRWPRPSRSATTTST